MGAVGHIRQEWKMDEWVSGYTGSSAKCRGPWRNSRRSNGYRRYCSYMGLGLCRKRWRKTAESANYTKPLYQVDRVNHAMFHYFLYLDDVRGLRGAPSAQSTRRETT